MRSRIGPLAAAIAISFSLNLAQADAKDRQMVKVGEVPHLKTPVCIDPSTIVTKANGMTYWESGLFCDPSPDMWQRVGTDCKQDLSAKMLMEIKIDYDSGKESRDSTDTSSGMGQEIRYICGRPH